MGKLALLCLRIRLCHSVAPGNPVPALALGRACKPQLKEPCGDSASANLLEGGCLELNAFGNKDLAASDFFFLSLLE